MAQEQALELEMVRRAKELATRSCWWMNSGRGMNETRFGEAVESAIAAGYWLVKNLVE